MKTKSINFLLLGLSMAVMLLTGCSSSDDDSDSEGPTTIITPDAGIDTYGLITDANGNPVSGVQVSDGYQVVQTNDEGIYQMKRDTAAKFVFYTNPSGYKPDSKGFYKALTSTSQRTDFTLGEAEDATHFNLLLITDPQVRSDESYRRFHFETMPDMQATIDSSSIPVQGLTLGDNVHEGCSEYEPYMRNQMQGLGIPFFSAIGNHDYFQVDGSTTTPRESSTYESSWGPTWYSFNRGKVHFVILNNVYFSDGSTYNDDGQISDEQLAWLKLDLSNVSKDDLIIVGYHIPMSYKTNSVGFSSLLSILSEFPHRILMAGHTHYTRHQTITSPISIEERVHAAACGAFWWTTVCSDGTPNGYSMYEINGNEIVNNYYKPTGKSKNFQIRLHHGDAEFGGTYGYYYFGTASNHLSSDYVVANVFNWDSNWNVTISENGGTAQAMTQGTLFSPVICYDAWAPGYLIGVRNRSATYFRAYNQHLFVYKLSDPDAEVTVTATDRYGNKYTQSEFTTDFSELKVNGDDFTP